MTLIMVRPSIPQSCHGLVCPLVEHYSHFEFAGACSPCVGDNGTNNANDPNIGNGSKTQIHTPDSVPTWGSNIQH